MCARATPSDAISAATSSAMPAIEYGVSGWSLCPAPRLSERDHAVRASEGLHLEGPGGVVAAPAHDKHHRLAVGGAEILIEESDAVDGDAGHRGRP